jgi:hypothetical protein
MFLGFPVPRAKIAEMIAGSAPPTVHHTWHYPDGSDPLAAPEDINPNDLLKWTGTKFAGQAGGAGGISTEYDDPDYFFQTWFASIDGFYTASSPANGVSISETHLTLATQGGGTNWASAMKTPDTFLSLWDWQTQAKFKTEITFAANGDSLPKFDVIWGDPDTGPHFGFAVKAGKLYGSVGNGSAQTLTDPLAHWGSSGYYETHKLEAVYKATSVDFYLDDDLAGTLNAGLPTGTNAARRIIRLYLRANTSTNYHGMNISYWKAWKQK